jgi:outer membrane protein TolC
MKLATLAIAVALMLLGCATQQPRRHARPNPSAGPVQDTRRPEAAGHAHLPPRAQQRPHPPEFADSDFPAVEPPDFAPPLPPVLVETNRVRQVVHVEESAEWEVDPSTADLPITNEMDAALGDELGAGILEMPAEEVAPGVEPLTLNEVIAAVDRSFPLLDAAQRERTIADGEQLAAYGEFDTSFKAYNETMALWYYKTQKAGVGISQPLLSGGYAFGGYKLGRGSFPSWDGDETNDGGEFNGGFAVPLLRDRAIDKRRAGVQKAALARRAVEPAIRTQRIEFVRAAAYAYWAWVAAGRQLDVNRTLLDNALERNQGLTKRAESGDLPEIELVDNQRLIVARRAKLIDADRKFRQAAVKLSLFYRDAGGDPLVPTQDRLPAEFPPPARLHPEQIDADISLALESRPELRELSLVMRQVDVELNLARNQTLPGMSAGAYAAQDVGGPTPKKDKGDFQLEASLLVDVPLQRRAAEGAIRAAQGKRAQLSAKARFVRDKVVTEVTNAATALSAAQRQIEQARESVRLADEMARAERRKFELGDSNLLLVNIREQQSADAAAVEIDAYEAYFEAEADYRAAIAVP